MNHSRTKRKRNKSQNLVQKPIFLLEFAVEMDIFTNEKKFPDWVFDFREDLLTKLSPTLKKVCRMLKGKVDFKIKYPIEIDGKCKFADIYIPKLKTVIVFLSSYKEFGNICHKTSERADFFKDRFRVIEFYEYHDAEYLNDKLGIK